MDSLIYNWFLLFSTPPAARLRKLEFRYDCRSSSSFEGDAEESFNGWAEEDSEIRSRLFLCLVGEM